MKPWDIHAPLAAKEEMVASQTDTGGKGVHATETQLPVVLGNARCGEENRMAIAEVGGRQKGAGGKNTAQEKMWRSPQWLRALT